MCRQGSSSGFVASLSLFENYGEANRRSDGCFFGTRGTSLLRRFTASLEQCCSSLIWIRVRMVVPCVGVDDMSAEVCVSDRIDGSSFIVGGGEESI